MTTQQQKDYMSKDELLDLKMALKDFIKSTNDLKDFDFETDDVRKLKIRLRHNLLQILRRTDLNDPNSKHEYIPVKTANADIVRIFGAVRLTPNGVNLLQ